MLQIIFFSIFLGLALVLLESDFTEKASVIFERCTSVVIKMIDTVMYFAPWCVFALVARVVALQGAGMLLNLISYVFTLLFVLLFHFIVVYCGALKFLGGVSPLKFLRKYWTVMVVGFSTSSSSATLPVNLEVCEKELGISNRVVSFSLPFGATVNMDGTAIMQGVAVLFIAQLYSIEPGITEQLQIILTCVLASIGTAGIPSAGLVMLTMVFQQAGLPLEAIGILWSVDRILDMTRTVVNVTGDAVASLVIAKSENEFDRTVFEA